MTSNSLRAWLATAARVIVGALLIWSGSTKMSNPRGFLQTVRAYDATPEWLSKAIAYGLPVLEIVLGVLLVVGVMTRILAAVSAVLLLVLTVGLLEVTARGIKVDPGVFSIGGPTTGATHLALWIVLTVVLLLLAAFVAWEPSSRWSVDEALTRHDYVEPPSAKRLASQQGRRKYEQAVEAKQREARTRTLFLYSGLGIVVVLVAVIGVGVQAGRTGFSPDPSTPNASAKYGVVYGKVAAARVDFYVDFGCTKCRELNQEVSLSLQNDVQANRAQVHFYPVSLYNARSSDDYSSRAANAALCAAAAGPDKYVKFQDILLGSYKGKQVQPAEGAAGPSDSDFVTYAQAAGLSTAQVSAFTTCVQANQNRSLVEAITETASQRGVSSVPVLRVNGKTIDDPNLAKLTAAIRSAAAKGPKPSPSPTPNAASSAATSGAAAGSSAAGSAVPSAAGSTAAAPSAAGSSAG